MATVHERLVAEAVAELRDQIGGVTSRELDGMAAVQLPARLASALLVKLDELDGIEYGIRLPNREVRSWGENRSGAERRVSEYLDRIGAEVVQRAVGSWEPAQ